MSTAAEISFHPLDAGRWPEFVRLFGVKGACAGCWCMYWRQRGAQWKERTNVRNKNKFQRIVEKGPPPGILACADDRAVGWCQIGPHESYSRLVYSRTKQPLDMQSVWIINCFYIARDFRGHGLMTQLIGAACAFARAQGARRVEGFPVNTANGRVAATFAYVGTPAAFEQSGFERVLDPQGKLAARFRRDLD